MSNTTCQLTPGAFRNMAHCQVEYNRMERRYHICREALTACQMFLEKIDQSPLIILVGQTSLRQLIDNALTQDALIQQSTSGQTHERPMTPNERMEHET